MIDYSTLNTKGYLVISNILNIEDLEWIRNDYKSIKQRFESEGASNKNYKLLLGTIKDNLYNQLKEHLYNIFKLTNLKTDMFFSKRITYFDSSLINFDWHIDHETYYKYQHTNSVLNFWFPVVKSTSTTSGLTIIPHDVFQSLAPDVFEERILNNGAKRLRVQQRKTVLYDDETGDEIILDFDINEYGVTPSVMPGDLLLLKGDVIHRTQKSSVDRVAFSIRAIDGDEVLTKEKFYSGCSRKKLMIKNNIGDYTEVVNAFNQYNSITIRSLFNSDVIK
jgi:hypothetical protein